MERTNYVDKAKRLMMQSARTTALVIVPLAAAVSAHAGVVLPTGNPTCSVLFNNPQQTSGCAFNVSSLSGGVSTGVSFSSQSGGINLFNSGSATDILTMSVTGTLTGGSFNGGIPLDFTATVTNAQSGGAYSVAWEVDGPSGGSVVATVTGVLVAGSNSLSRSTTLGTFAPVFASGSTVTEKVTFAWAVNSGSTNVTFPFNFDAVQSSNTPEPASVGIVAAGLGFLGALWRRRKKA